MTGRELEQICRQYPDHEFLFSVAETDDTKKGLGAFNVRTFEGISVCDVSESDRTVTLDGKERT